ncbi:hypothetical protein PTTG_11900 [Puccinia triticina 1-1 BBBD Race 1]|uniref:Secreted protein n=1 Tax=Puccinia triticina (isolate 1-1 / race 1 (BBBD)) TaxID=630390 RepID=A0A180GJB1_PUCT1|nr:hypothetical protein PTTG_11900 [Puccinia triticina 1-1 BBBD Race 1]
MFAAGATWKLYVISAVIALAGLPAVQLAEVQGHALSQRAPTPRDGVKANGPVRCGRSWNTQPYPTKAPPVVGRPEPLNLATSCRGDDGLGYLCNFDSCHQAEKQSSYHRSKTETYHLPLESLRFVGCTRYRNANEKGPLQSKVEFMHPHQIWPDDGSGKIAVMGVDVASGWNYPKDSIDRRHECSKLEPVNNRRPVCDECIHHTFKEVAPPAIPKN